MPAILLVARLVLAAVFVVAATAKLADRSATRRALRDFGLPDALVPWLVVLLPLAELAIALLLLPAATAWLAAACAGLLLLAFSAAIGWQLRHGRAPACHCFGRLSSAPAGRGTLARNAALTALAALVVAFGRVDAGPSAVGWLQALSGAQIAGLLGGGVLAALVAVEGGLLLQLLRQNGRLLLRIEALEERVSAPSAASQPEIPPAAPARRPRVAAPGFQLPDVLGVRHTLDSLRAPGLPVVLLFSDPGCTPCTSLLPDVARWQHEHAGCFRLALLSRGQPAANRAKSSEHGLRDVLLQHDYEVAAAYGASGTPSAVLVLPDGTIGSPVAAGADEIRALIDLVAADTESAPVEVAAGYSSCSCGKHAPRAADASPADLLGTPAPALRLPDLDGAMVDLGDFVGRDTLVLFWNPGCGYCLRMLDDLKRWEATRTPDAPALLIVSSGSVAANAAHDLSAPLVLDQGFEAGRAWGAAGTPTAVLVDAQGSIASPVAVGADAVFALLQGRSELSQSV